MSRIDLVSLTIWQFAVGFSNKLYILGQGHEDGGTSNCTTSQRGCLSTEILFQDEQVILPKHCTFVTSQSTLVGSFFVLDEYYPEGTNSLSL